MGRRFAARQQPHRKADAKTGNVDEGKHHSPPSDATHTLSYSSFILQGYSGATFYDWGNYINEVTPSISEDNLWFTLSRAEWAYLLYTRGVSYARFAKVQVEGANGLLLFPDEFLWPNDNLTQPTALNDASAAFTQIEYTAAQFSELEDAGCVFLRANGYIEHNGHNPTHADQTYGYYWTNDFDGNQTHSYLYFDEDIISPNSNNAQMHAGYAMCIRLARRAE